MLTTNKATIQMQAVISEWERDQIIERTKSTLASAKTRTCQLAGKSPDKPFSGLFNVRTGSELHRKAYLGERIHSALTFGPIGWHETLELYPPL